MTEQEIVKRYAWWMSSRRVIDRIDVALHAWRSPSDTVPTFTGQIISIVRNEADTGGEYTSGGHGTKPEPEVKTPPPLNPPEGV